LTRVTGAGAATAGTINGAHISTSVNTGGTISGAANAIRATIELMEAPASKINIRHSYNLGGMSFSPKEIAAAIQKHIPDFTISYKTDYRQQIADGWPQSIDDSVTRADWGWKEEYDLQSMTADMLENLQKEE
jgi:nucleoside-diphosphate-sugar epimerase